MGVQAAFSTWAIAVLDAAKDESLTTTQRDDLLDQLESGYSFLYDQGVLRDATFVQDAIDPLRIR